MVRMCQVTEMSLPAYLQAPQALQRLACFLAAQTTSGGPFPACAEDQCFYVRNPTAAVIGSTVVDVVIGHTSVANFKTSVTSLMRFMPTRLEKISPQNCCNEKRRKKDIELLRQNIVVNSQIILREKIFEF